MEKISVVIPCYNSEKTIYNLVELTMATIKDLGYYSEFVLVNDFSKDNTMGEIEKLTQKYDNVIGVNLAKNAGQHNAIITALRFVSGDYVLAMDDDMQTHPNQIHKLLDRLNEGYDLVYGKYKKKQENPLRLLFSKLNNMTLGTMIHQPKNITTSSYWIAKRFLIEEIKKYPHAFTNIRGLFFRSTSNIGDVYVEHYKREYGKSNYSFASLLKLWSTCINFSVVPLRIFLVIGFISAFLGFLGFIVILIRKLLGVDTLLGWASTMSAIMFFSGMMLTCMGVIGEYVGRIFMCINNTPQAVIKEIIRGNESEK